MTTMNKIERAHIQRVKETPCVLCTHIGQPAALESDAHHIREGQGMAQRAGNFLVVALCKGCHQGPAGIHGLGKRQFEARYKLTELDLLDLTLAAIARRGEL